MACGCRKKSQPVQRKQQAAKREQILQARKTREAIKSKRSST